MIKYNTKKLYIIIIIIKTPAGQFNQERDAYPIPLLRQFTNRGCVPSRSLDLARPFDLDLDLDLDLCFFFPLRSEVWDRRCPVWLSTSMLLPRLQRGWGDVVWGGVRHLFYDQEQAGRLRNRTRHHTPDTHSPHRHTRSVLGNLGHLDKMRCSGQPGSNH